MPRLLIALLIALGLVAPASATAATFYIKGRGYGHGVGMSQWGAQGYALHGWGYAKILAHYYQGTALGKADAATRLRVQLASAASVRLVHASKANGTRLDPSHTYIARPAGGGVEVSSSSGRTVGRYRSVSFTGYRGYFYLGQRQLNGHGPGDYRGSLSVRRGGGGLSAVNLVSLDAYAQAVVPSEVPYSWDPDALRVQAVAARSYALTTGAGHTLYPDTRSQMYSGMSIETSRTNAAVRATRGQVVTYHGTPITTFYFSTSGGRTENIENSFIGATPEPYLRSVVDRYDSISPEHTWQVRLSMSAAGSRLSGLYSGAFRGIDVLRRGVSPRIVRARVLGSRSSRVTDGPTLRARLGTMDTWMRFYVVSAHRAGARAAAVGGAAGEGTAPERVSRRDGSVLAGAIAGAPRGAWATVQRRRGDRWVAADRVRLGSGGGYAWAAPAPGAYRVTWGGMPSDAVRLG